MDHPFRHCLVRAAALLVAAVLLAACGATPAATSAPPPTAQPSDTPLPASPTPPPTLAPPPTATATPSPPRPVPTPTAQRISFAPGTTSAAFDGSLSAQATHRYLLQVMAGQWMDVQAEPHDRLHLVAYGADGTLLWSGMGDGASFRGTVPSTQDYVLDLSAGSDAVAYHLEVAIPARISFAPGATSAVVEGELALGARLHYVLQVEAGQWMDLQAEPHDRLRLVLYGADGTVLKSGMGDGAFFRGAVPSTQDYFLHLDAAEAVSFSLSVVIPARISFAPGATSATVEGHLEAFGAQYYILRAMGGQTMEVNAGPQGMVRLIIYGVDGTVLMSGMGDGASFSGTLPSDQDYIVCVAAGDQAADTVVEVSIQ